MRNEFIIPLSDSSDSSIGSNGDCNSATASAPPTTHKRSLNQLTPTSNRPKTQRVTAPPPPSPSVRMMQPPALQVNDNAVGRRARQDPVGLTFSWPYGGGTKPRPLAPFPSSGAGHSFRGATSSPAHRVGNDHQPSRTTVDFLSQMHAGGSAPRQVERQTPPNETLEEWASTLRLGNGRDQPLNLNLKLRLN